MISVAFFLSVLVLYLQSTLYPELPVLAFAPFITLVCLQRSLLLCTTAGLTLDLLSQETFGLHAIVYTLTGFICFRWRRLFSLETPMSFSMYTALISLVCTTTHIVLLFLFDRRVPFPGTWWLTQWLSLPLFDGAYALIWFTGPLALVKLVQKRWVIYKRQHAN